MGHAQKPRVQNHDVNDIANEQGMKQPKVVTSDLENISPFFNPAYFSQTQYMRRTFGCLSSFFFHR